MAFARLALRSNARRRTNAWLDGYAKTLVPVLASVRESRPVE
jgi:hypothetical protein